MNLTDVHPALVYGVVGLAAAGAVTLAARLIRRVRHRHMDAAKLASILDEEGYHELAVVLDDYAMRDWPGLAKSIKDLRTRLHDSAQRQELFDAVFRKQLAKRVVDPDERAKILQALGLSEPEAPPAGAPASGTA